MLDMERRKERGYLYWLSDADEISFGKYRSRFSGQRKKQAVEIINGLYLLDVENRSRVEQEILQAELKNTFLTFMDVSKKGRGFTSLVFGMGQLSEEGIAKKLQSR